MCRTPRIFVEYREGVDAGEGEDEEKKFEWEAELAARGRKKDRALTARMKRRGLPPTMKKRKRKRKGKKLTKSPAPPALPDSIFSRGSTVKATYIAPTRREKSEMIRRQRRRIESAEARGGDVRVDVGLERGIRQLERKRRAARPEDFRKRRKQAKRSRKQLASLLRSI